MSYRKKHVKSKIRNIKPKKSVFKRLWFWLLTLFSIIILSAFYFFLFYPGLQIKNITISGNEKIKTEELQDLIFNNANTGLIKFWNIKITSRSIFLVNTNNLNNEIIKKFPEIEKAKVNKKLPQTLTLEITERKPLGVYCGGANDTKECYLIDNNGVIFEPLDIIPEDLFIVRQTLRDENLYTGESIVQQDVISGIANIQKNLKDNFQINLKEAFITSPIRLDVKTADGWQIYFNLDYDSDINSQIIELNLLLNGDVNSEVRKKLQYIDLRFKDRAYYK